MKVMFQDPDQQLILTGSLCGITDSLLPIKIEDLYRCTNNMYQHGFSRTSICVPAPFTGTGWHTSLVHIASSVTRCFF